MSDPVSVTYVLISISMRYSLRGGGGFQPPTVLPFINQIFGGISGGWKPPPLTMLSGTVGAKLRKGLAATNGPDGQEMKRPHPPNL